MHIETSALQFLTWSMLWCRDSQPVFSQAMYTDGILFVTTVLHCAVLQCAALCCIAVISASLALRGASHLTSWLWHTHCPFAAGQFEDARAESVSNIAAKIMLTRRCKCWQELAVATLDCATQAQKADNDCAVCMCNSILFLCSASVCTMVCYLL